MTRDLPFDDASGADDDYAGDTAYRIATGVSRVTRAGAYVTGGALIAAGGSQGENGAPINHDSRNVGWSQVNDPKPDEPSPTLTFPDLTEDALPYSGGASPVADPFDNGQYGTDAGLFPGHFGGQGDATMAGFGGLGLPESGTPAFGLGYGDDSHNALGMPLESSQSSESALGLPLGTPQSALFDDDQGGFLGGLQHMQGLKLPGTEGLHLPGMNSGGFAPPGSGFENPSHTGPFDGIGEGFGAFVKTSWEVDAHAGLDGVWVRSELNVDIAVGNIGNQFNEFGRDLSDGIAHAPGYKPGVEAAEQPGSSFLGGLRGLDEPNAAANAPGHQADPQNGGAPAPVGGAPNGGAAVPANGLPNGATGPGAGATAPGAGANAPGVHGPSLNAPGAAGPSAGAPGLGAPAAPSAPAAGIGAPAPGPAGPIGPVAPTAPAAVAPVAPAPVAVAPVAPVAVAPVAPIAVAPVAPVAVAPIVPVAAAPAPVVPVAVAQPVVTTPLQTTIQPDAASQPIANLLAAPAVSPLTAPAATAPALLDLRQPTVVAEHPDKPATMIAQPLTSAPGTSAPQISIPSTADSPSLLTTAPTAPTTKLPGATDPATTKLPGLTTAPAVTTAPGATTAPGHATAPGGSTGPGNTTAPVVTNPTTGTDPDGGLTTQPSVPTDDVDVPSVTVPSDDNDSIPTHQPTVSNPPTTVTVPTVEPTVPTGDSHPTLDTPPTIDTQPTIDVPDPTIATMPPLTTKPMPDMPKPVKPVADVSDSGHHALPLADTTPFYQVHDAALTSNLMPEAAFAETHHPVSGAHDVTLL
ncbi:DUF5585 domain-containing protein [Nocardia sp. IFM 10818]